MMQIRMGCTTTNEELSWKEKLKITWIYQNGELSIEGQDRGQEL